MSSILTRLGSCARIRSRIAISAASTVSGAPVERRVREQPVDRAFEIAAVRADGARDEGEHRAARPRNAAASRARRRCAPRGSSAAAARRARRSRRTGRTPRRERTRSSSASRSFGGRSAATITSRPASSSALSAWPNSAWIVLPCRNCASSKIRRSMARSRSLKAIAVCACSAATKPYMNFSAVR